MDTIFGFFGQLIAAGGGGAVVAYLLFQYLGKSWIENKFARQIEQMRHEQSMELQRLRVEIDSLLSGAIRLQEKEFEVLPAAWEKLFEAYALVYHLSNPLYYCPNFDQLDAIQLDELLETTDFLDSQKDKVRNSQNKKDTYGETKFWHDLHKAQIAFSDLQRYVAHNGIFLQSELKKKFAEISSTLSSAIASNQARAGAQGWELQTQAWTKLDKETEPLYKEIEEYIQTRLKTHGGKS